MNQKPPHPETLHQEMRIIPLPDNRFLNRELSWLAFNERVLEEAENRGTPLLERIRFLSISANNLDEFYTVRVANLHYQLRNEPLHTPPCGLTPEQQLKAIIKATDILLQRQEKCWIQLQKQLYKNSIHIVNFTDLNENEQQWAKDYFTTKIIPELKPAIIKNKNSFPFLPNLGLARLLHIHNHITNHNITATIPIPTDIKRFVELPAQSTLTRFILLDDMLKQFQLQLFSTILPDHTLTDLTIKSQGYIRIIRDSELQLDSDTDSLLRSVKSALKKRESGNIIHIYSYDNTPSNLLKTALKSLDADESCIIKTNSFQHLNNVEELCQIDRDPLKFLPYHSRFPERIDDYGGDCFAAIGAKDIIVHHPYESFNVVVQFLQQAAQDPRVTNIKQTLYRTSDNSPIVHALLDAARNGKHVTAVVELRARFDEAANISWGTELEKAGVKVIFTVPHLKIHAKISLVTRVIDGQHQQFAHYGTGNYHPITAKTYTDLSYFTCSPPLCRDAAKIFSYLEKTAKSTKKSLVDITPPSLEKVIIAPFHLRKSLLSLIEDEITHANAGEPANIWIKANSLLDSELIDALYRASRAGVSVDLVIRGICTLRPGVPGLSDNIRVKSIVGRFLEHARIFCFSGGAPLPSSRSKVFISSADWMPRNMDKRIELIVPIENPTVHEQILSQIMVANLKDERNSWVMEDNGNYIRRPFAPSSFSAHAFFMANPSLSGRGSAIRRNINKTPDLSETAPDSDSERIAVIDIGSNSVRMVVYDSLKRVPLPIFNEKVLCGLAKGVQESGTLSPKGSILAYNTLNRFSRILNAMKVRTICALATSAVRDANDGKEFLQNIQKQTGFETRVLSGKEEARYAALGVASGMFSADGVVCDLGGGSLELARLHFDQQKLHKSNTKSSIVRDTASFPLGAVRLQSLMKQGHEEVHNLINSHLDKYPLESLLKNKTLFAIGGGFRALGKIHLAQNDYPLNILDHYTISPSEFLNTVTNISHMSPRKIIKLPSVSENRKHTLAICAMVMMHLLTRGKPSEIIISVYGIREGLLFDMLPPDIRAHDALISGATDMITRISPEQNDSMTTYGKEMARWMSPLFPDESPYMIRLRRAACILTPIAWHEHVTYRAEMAFRWVMDTELPAIDHWERAFIATTLFYRYQSSDARYITHRAEALLTDRWVSRARNIGLAMRLAQTITGGADALLTRTRITTTKNELRLHCAEADVTLINQEVHKRLAKLASAIQKSSKVITE